MRKLIGTLLMISILITTMSGCVKKQPEGEAIQPTEPTLVVESVKATVGATSVQVPIVVYNNPGVAGATFQFAFEPEITLQKAVSGSVLESMDFSCADMTTRPFKCSWDSIDGQSELDGLLLTLTFAIPENAQTGDVYNISISYRVGDVYNNDWADVNFAVVNGSITIE